MSRIPGRPEPCLSAPCRSPFACNIWGYCRERNMTLKSMPTDEQQRTWRKEAAKRSTATPSDKENAG